MSKPKFYRGPGGALMCDRALLGLTQELTDAESVRWYGGSFFVGESMGEYASQQIAVALGGEWLGEPPTLSLTITSTHHDPSI
jgi:hypothetical protein